MVEKLENILPPGGEPSPAEAVADMKTQLSQFTDKFDAVVAEILLGVRLFAGMLSEPSSRHQNNAPDDREDVPEPVQHNEEHVPVASSFDSTQWTPEPGPVGPDEEHVATASNLRSTQWTQELDVQASSNSWQEAAGNSWQQARGNSWEQAGCNQRA